MTRVDNVFLSLCCIADTSLLVFRRSRTFSLLNDFISFVIYYRKLFASGMNWLNATFFKYRHFYIVSSRLINFTILNDDRKQERRRKSNYHYITRYKNWKSLSPSWDSNPACPGRIYHSFTACATTTSTDWTHHQFYYTLHNLLLPPALQRKSYGCNSLKAY